jgi:MFS superfamily sulfate permease-like transporter
VIYRFDAPLIFANASTFREEITSIARGEPRPAWIVIAAEPMTDIDTTAADMLADLDTDLAALNVRLSFAELKDAVRQKTRSYGSALLDDDSRFYPTVSAATKAYRDVTGIERPFHGAEHRPIK